MFCPQCGATITPDDDFCPSCGTDVRSVPREQQPVPAQPTQPMPTQPAPQQAATPYAQPAGVPPTKSKAPLVIGIVLSVVFLLLVGCGVGGYFLYTRTMQAAEESLEEAVISLPAEEAPLEAVPPEEAEAPTEEQAAPTLNPESATDVVGRMLTALQQDDVATMESLATPWLRENEAGFFYPSDGLFTDFEINDVYQDGGTYVVVVTESWPSGPEVISYVVVEQDGSLLVDAILYDY